MTEEQLFQEAMGFMSYTSEPVADLAERFDVPTKTIFKWFAGTEMPSEPVRFKVYSYLFDVYGWTP